MLKKFTEFIMSSNSINSTNTDDLILFTQVKFLNSVSNRTIAEKDFNLTFLLLIFFVFSC